MAASVTVHSNAHYFPIFQPILMNLASKSMIHRALFINILIIRVAAPLTSVGMGIPTSPIPGAIFPVRGIDIGR